MKSHNSFIYFCGTLLWLKKQMLKSLPNTNRCVNQGVLDILVKQETEGVLKWKAVLKGPHTIVVIETCNGTECCRESERMTFL